MKKRLFLLLLAGLLSLLLVACSDKDPSLGIIGGADGPTAIFIS